MNRSTSAAEASTRWPMSRQACCRRAAVFMVSSRNAFANDHGPAMKRGSEVCPEAEVANVGVGAFVQLLQRVEAGADAVPVPKAGGKWPGGNDLIANVFVDYAALRHDRSRDVTDEAVQKIEEAGLAARR